MTHHADFNPDPGEAGDKVFGKSLIDKVKRIEKVVDADLAEGELERRSASFAPREPHDAPSERPA